MMLQYGGVGRLSLYFSTLVSQLDAGYSYIYLDISNSVCCNNITCFSHEVNCKILNTNIILVTVCYGSFVQTEVCKIKPILVQHLNKSYGLDLLAKWADLQLSYTLQ